MNTETKIIIRIKEERTTNEVVETIMNEFHQNKKFIDAVKVKGNEIIVDSSNVLTFEEDSVLLPRMIKAIAKNCDCDFTCETDFEDWDDDSSIGRIADCKDGMLIIKTIEIEDLYGYCDECGEYQIHFEDYKNDFIECPICGAVLGEDELFPNGYPTWETKSYKVNEL